MSTAGECRCQIVGWTSDPGEPHIPPRPEWEQADDCPVHPLSQVTLGDLTAAHLGKRITGPAAVAAAQALLAERDALAAKVQRFAQMLANQAVGVNDALSQAHQKIAQVEALLDLVVGEQGRSALVLASSVRAALAGDEKTP